MSTQLIVYPQNYNGQYNSISNPFTAGSSFLTDGINFSTISGSSLYSTDAVKPALSAIINDHPYILNAWYRFTTIVGPPGNWGAVTAPALAINKLELSYNGSDAGHTGVYQQLSGLTVGAFYAVKIQITTGQTGTLSIATYMPNTAVEGVSAQFSSNTTAINWSFQATSTNQVLSIDYAGETGNLLIETIQVLSITTTPSGIFTDLEDGQVICDLYQEEDIPLTLSIDDFKNVAEKVQSYSKGFSLPATKRNNQIFNNMFDVTRADDGIIFNPYVKTKCVLKQDGFILFEGYLRLIDVKDKNGEISYNVNLYSEVIVLADLLKNRTFADLDFSELTHAYNYTEIRNSWQGALGLENPLPIGTFAGTPGASVTNVLKYPFIDWTHQYTVSGGNPVLPNLESAFKPCIQLKYIIDNIFAAAGFTYTSNFFDTTVASGGSFDFDKLYMDFNWDSNDLASEPSMARWAATSPPGSGPTNISSLTTWQTYPMNFIDFTPDLNWDSANNRFVSLNNNTQYNLDVAVSLYWTGSLPIGCSLRIAHRDSAGSLLFSYGEQYFPLVGSTNNENIYKATESVLLQQNDTLQVEFKSDSANKYHTIANENGICSGCSENPQQIIATTGGSLVTDDALLETLRGELGQWEFLKGIMTMFNLVSIVDEDNPDNILIEPYSDVFITNPNIVQHDWTDKVDVSQMELKPLTDLNKNTIFKFVEDEDDYCFGVYKTATSGYLYGSKEIDASGFTILQGTEEITAEPFAATVSKPLMSQYSDFIVPSLYAMSEEGTTEGFENSPRILYENWHAPNGPKTLTSCTYFVPTQHGVAGDNAEDEFLQFSHLTTIPTVFTTPPAITDTADFVFESNQLFDPIGSPPTNNLYNSYWSPYFNELYNADTRIMKLKVNLSASDVASFKFYDTVFIKNRVFRVNKIQYKPNTLAKVEFILIP